MDLRRASLAWGRSTGTKVLQGAIRASAHRMPTAAKTTTEQSMINVKDRDDLFIDPLLAGSGAGDGAALIDRKQARIEEAVQGSAAATERRLRCQVLDRQVRPFAKGAIPLAVARAPARA
jgi:hypothetical protein